MTISALTGDGRDVLVAALLSCCGAGEIQGLQVALNGRQRELAAAAAASLGTVAGGRRPGPALGFLDHRSARRHAGLGAITGEEVSEAVLDRIFSRFCIGK